MEVFRNGIPEGGGTEREENRGKHVSNPSPRITLNTGIIEWLLKSWVLKER